MESKISNMLSYIIEHREEEFSWNGSTQEEIYAIGIIDDIRNGLISTYQEIEWFNEKKFFKECSLAYNKLILKIRISFDYMNQVFF